VVFFCNSNGKKKDLCILQRYILIVPGEPLERLKLIVAEIEGLDSIHEVLSRKNLMLLTNQIKEIFIVI
jgi:hypothetical protein